MSGTIQSSPFHARAAALNLANAWVVRNDMTLAAAYTDANDEALVTRTRVGLADLSSRWQLVLEGPREAEFLQRLLTRDVSTLAPGTALKALWLNDNGGVRGAGVIARYGKESFRLTGFVPDREWILATAKLFDVTCREPSNLGGLGLIGPYAKATLEAAVLPADIDLLAFRVISWRGAEVTLTRFGQQNGYELWCNADDALVVWDQLDKAGAPFGLQPVGVDAADILDLEAGVPRPGRDFIPAADSGSPDPRALGMERLIDESHPFNGRTAYLARSREARLQMVGLEIDSEEPAPFAHLMHNGVSVGSALSSCYSPALRRAIALAQVGPKFAEPGTKLNLTLPPSLDTPQVKVVSAKVVTLPFLPAPDFVRA